MADDLLTMKIQIDDRDYLKVQRSQKNFQYSLVEIERAYQKGELTAKQYNRQLVIQTKELQKLGFTYNQASSQIRKYASTIRNATSAQLAQAQAISLSGKGMRRFEILAQQAGYQVGDFAVQVQGGTNIAVAFGQQMSQLLGFFGPKGAVAGAAVAIGTGLIAPLLKAKQEAENLTDSLEALRDSEDIIEKLGESIDKNLVGKFDLVRKEFGSLIGDIYKFQAEGLKKAITAGFGGIAGQAVGMAGIAGYGPSAGEMTRRQIQVEDILGGIGGDTAQEVAKSVQDAYDKLSELPFITETAKENFRQIALDNGIIADLVDYQEGGFKKQVETNKKLQQIQTDAMAMEAEIAKERLDNTKRNYVFAGRLMREAANEQEITDATRQSRIEANYQIAGRLMAQASEEQQKLADETHAHMMALQKAYYEDAKKQAREVASATYLANYNAVLAYQAYGKSRMAAPDEPVKAPKVGKKVDVVGDMLKQIQHQTKLLKLTDEEQRKEEILFNLKKQDVKMSDKRIDQLVKESEAYFKLNEEREKQIARVDQIGDAFGDMLMNIVDGTMKADEAFKNFMANVIKQLYQETAIDPAVTFLKSLLANGGVMSRGNLTPFANGGVVNGPTLFPMANGMGLMGEAGPEAIMPLKRGKDGKLGVEGGGNVVVNQTINVSTGVQQTVRTEIKSLMPQIAESAKAAVADAKRRGGSYGRNFA